MKIRKAESFDINNNLLNLYIKGFNMHYEKRKDIFQKKSRDELNNNLIEMINNPNEIIFVIDDNEKILGYAVDLCQVFRHFFSNNLILPYLNLFQFAY